MLSCQGYVENDRVVYYENEKTPKVIVIIEGNREVWLLFDDNRNLHRKLSYMDSKLDGEVLRYHENGLVKIKAQYKNGKKHGRIQQFDRHGALLGESEWRYGKFIRTINNFDSLGNVIVTCSSANVDP